MAQPRAQEVQVEAAYMHPRVIIAAPHSGAGKTTVTMGIIGALNKNGLTVQPFKAGPDYIDPGHHSRIAGRSCRNLDTMLLEKDNVLELFHRHSEDVDISIIEGVMGLFDGAFSVKEKGSTADLAKILKCPVILVIDVKAMAQSAGAIALGFTLYDRQVPVAGFILNRVGSSRHYAIAGEAIEKATGLPVLGFMKKDDSLSIPERHLGLVPSQETRQDSLYDRIESAVTETVDIDALLRIARSASPLPVFSTTIFAKPETFLNVRIAYAYDEAFHFYYRDNIDILEFLGAEVVPFSPLKDSTLPENIHLVYFGGGYPEMFAEKLSENRGLMEDIRSKAEDGLSIYGECGGLMYLLEGITCFDRTSYPMTGILPGRAVMQQGRMALGYCEVETLARTGFGPAGEVLKGHVFHWSDIDGLPSDYPFVFRVKKDTCVMYDGITYNNVLASYVHLHFLSNPQWPRRLLEHALEGGAF